MRFARRVLILAVLVAARGLHARVAEAQTQGCAKILDRLSMRQNLDTEHQVAQPASFVLTVPDSGATRAVALLGARVNIVPCRSADLLDLGPFVEYQRNTDIKKPQDVLRAGLSAEWQTRGIGDSALATWSPVLLAQVDWKRDRINSTRSFQAAVLFTAVSVGRGPPNTTARIGHGAVDLVWAPIVGLEAEADSSADVVRSVERLAVDAYPLGPKLGRRLELSGGVVLRQDVARPAAASGSRSHKLYTFDANFYFVNDVESGHLAGVGASYSDGEDPVKGLAKQRFWQFGIRMQW